MVDLSAKIEGLSHVGRYTDRLLSNLAHGLELVAVELALVVLGRAVGDHRALRTLPHHVRVD